MYYNNVILSISVKLQDISMWSKRDINVKVYQGIWQDINYTKLMSKNELPSIFGSVNGIEE